MPVIPQLQEQQRLEPSAPVQAISTNDARNVGNSLSQFGQQVSQLGEAMDRAQLQTDVTKGSIDIDNAYSEAILDAQRTGKADGSDVKQKITEFADKRLAKLGEQYNSLGSQTRLEGYKSKVQQRALEEGLKLQFDRQQSYIIGQNKEIIDAFSDRARQFPENAATEFNGFLTNHLQGLQDSKVITPESFTKVKEIAQKKFANSYIDGLILQKKYSTAMVQLGAVEQDQQMTLSQGEARDLGIPGTEKLTLQTMKGEKLSPELSELMRSLTPDEKANYLQRVQNQMEQDSRVKLSSVVDKLNAVTYFNLSGKPVDAFEMRNVENLIANSPPEIRDTLKDRLNVSKQLAPLAQNAANMSPEKISLMLEQAKSKILNQPGEVNIREDREKTLIQFEQSMQQLIKQRTEDPAAFIASRSNEIGTLYAATKDGNPQATQAYVNQIQAAQTAQGVLGQDQKLLPKQDAVMMGKTIQAAQALGGEYANSELEKLQNQWGPHYPQVIAQIQADNKNIGDEVMAAARMPQKESRIRVLESQKNKKVYDEAFKNTFIQGEATNLTLQLKANFDDVRSGLRSIGSGPNNTSTQSMFFNLAETEAKRLMLESNKSAKDAAKTAIKTVFDNNFTLIESGRNAVLMPRLNTHSEQFTRNFLNTYGDFNSEGVAKIDDLNIKIPAGASKEALQKKLSSDSQWLTLPDQSGVGLYVVNNGQTLPVLDRNDMPVRKSFYDITRSNDPRILKGR